MPLLLLFTLLVWFSQPACAVIVPSGMRPSDVSTLVSELGPASATRVLRSAESYVAWPGIKVGVELLAIPTRDLPTLGNGDGAAPGVLPAPRLYLAKGLGNDLEFFGNLMPVAMKNSVSTWGLGLKWSAQKEEETWVAIGGYVAYTHVNGFDSAYNGHDIETGVIISKDYVRIKPYLSAGILAAQGSVGTLSSWQAALHLALGTEIELPVNFSVQLDFMNLYPMGSVFIGKKF